jgi:hypothetical protein
MNCPEHLIFKSQYLQVWHMQHADIRREYVTWREVFNPLRYDICVGRGPGRYWHWNNDAWMNLKWSNFWFRFRQMCWLRGHDFKDCKYSDGAGCSRCYKRKPTSLKEADHG